MSRQLQFAFLGPHNSYLASVTWVNQSGCPYEPPMIACYGLPGSFVESYRKFAENKFVYNVRGHDCFSYLGEWTKESTKGHTPASSHMLNEIDALKSLAADNKNNSPSYREEDLLLSLGPGSGAFFADAFRLRRYRWSNLPSELEDQVQREICRKGYGTIYDVSMNAADGWVMQFDKGKTYKWGGTLPEELERALFEGRKRKLGVKQLYLNHQNKHDYILIFADGNAHISVHQGFEQPLYELISLTFSKREKLKWNFTSSCSCHESLQHPTNGAYYNQRGHFHFRQSNFQQALMYMREAHDLDYSNVEYFEDYCMALVAVRKLDPTPEESFMRFDSNNAFRNEYAFMRAKIKDVAAIEGRMQEVLRQTQQQQQPRLSGWTYSEATPSVVELPGAEVRRSMYELEHEQSNETMFSDSLSSRESSKHSVLRFWR